MESLAADIIKLEMLTEEESKNEVSINKHLGNNLQSHTYKHIHL